MLHVLRHYFPVRKALLIASETALLSVIVYLAMSFHLAVGRVTPKLAMELAYLGMSPTDARWRVLSSALLVSIIAQVAISLNELYDFRISSSVQDRAARFMSSVASAIFLVLVAVALVDLWELRNVLDFPGLPTVQRVVILTFTLMVGFALLWFWRVLFHFLMRRWNFNERVLILGAGQPARTLADEIQKRPDCGYEVVGVISGRLWMRPDAPEGSAGNEAERPSTAVRRAPRTVHEGALETSAATTQVLERELRAPGFELRGEMIGESLYELARRLDIDTVSVAVEDRRGTLPTGELLRCRLQGVEIEEGETLYERVTGKVAVEAMRPSYLIFNRGFLQEGGALAAKRVLDVILALVGLLFTWPLMLITAIAVRLDSPGPILFRQERTGLHGRPFTLLKFRSMRADAEAGTGPVWAREGDPRITRTGRFLRGARLDELPQLFNVLAGSMSLVGPRPERGHFVSELVKQIPYYDQRHIVKPGLTGWAQINYPYGNTVADAIQKLQYDLFYAKHQSLLFDVSILFTTIKTVVLRRGT